LWSCKMRRCSTCHEDKQDGEFHKNQWSCRSCKRNSIAEWRRKNPERTREISRRSAAKHPDKVKARNRAYYQKNRERAAQQERKRYQRLKDEAYAAYGGYRCVCCGETERLFLCLDHVNNDGNKHRQEVAPVRLYYWLKQQRYPPIVQVMCFNCNQGKRLNGGICPHQRKSVAI
jgi:hypothetical protein